MLDPRDLNPAEPPTASPPTPHPLTVTPPADADARPAAVTRAIAAAGWTAMLLGGVYLAAWLGGAAASWSAAGVITMKTNMSLALVLAGAAVVLLNGRNISVQRRAAAIAAAGVVAIIGTLTLVQHVFRVDLGIDQLIATELPGAAATVSPNRVGPPGSTSLALIGAGLLALAWRRRIAFYLGLATSVVVAVPAIGFLYGIGPFYGTARVTGIAWPTVIALFSVATALMLATSDGPGARLWRPDPGGVLLRRLLIPTVSITLVLGYVRVQGERHGLYDTATGTGLFALALILMFSALLWRSAAQLSDAAAATRRAGDALKEREERLRLFIEHAPAAVAMFDREMKYLAASRRFCSDLGLGSSHLMGRSHYEVFPEIPDRWKEIHRRCLAGAIEKCDEDPFPRSDGSVDWVRWEIHPWRDAAGEVGGIVLFSEIVTERKRAVEQLAAEKERLAVTLGSIGDAVIATDDAGRVTVFNAVSEKLTGWSAREAIGRPLREVFRIENELTREPAVDPVARVLRDGVVVGLANHTVLVGRDGSETPIADSAAPIRDARGRIVGVVMVFRDQAEERKAEQALRDSEERLRHAMEALVDVDRRRSAFLGVLSHELRNPLAPIRNSIYLLDRAPADGEQAARARAVIRRQTDHLARLVDDLLDVTRIARGKIELRRERLDLLGVVRRTCEDYRTLFQGRRIELALQDSGPVWVDGDETRIAQMVGNLLQNAVKFSHEGGNVAVRVASLDGQAVLSVRDQGIGMTPEHMRHLFEPFAQADGTLARTRGGLGLGLALVKGLADLHGGSIEGKSDGLDRGSEFVLRLPLTSAPAAPVPAPEGRGAHQVLHILIIEDNVDAADSLAEVLKTAGHRVHVATDGQSGIALARERRPDVVLCDIGLPDVDGYEVARTLRREESLRGVRLVALTGYAGPQDKALADEAGFDTHLAKPPALERLLAMLGSSGRQGVVN